MDHAEIRTDELTAQGAVLVVRVPADCREELSGIRSYVADSLAMGVLVLEDRMSFRVERFPPLGGVTVVRAEQAAPDPPGGERPWMPGPGGPAVRRENHSGCAAGPPERPGQSGHRGLAAD